MFDSTGRKAIDRTVLQPDLQSQVQAAHEAQNRGVPTPSLRDLRQANELVEPASELPESHLLTPLREDEGQLAPTKRCKHTNWCACQKLWTYYDSEHDGDTVDPVSN